MKLTVLFYQGCEMCPDNPKDEKCKQTDLFETRKEETTGKGK